MKKGVMHILHTPYYYYYISHYILSNIYAAIIITYLTYEGVQGETSNLCITHKFKADTMCIVMCAVCDNSLAILSKEGAKKFFAGCPLAHDGIVVGRLLKGTKRLKNGVMGWVEKKDCAGVACCACGATPQEKRIRARERYEETVKGQEPPGQVSRSGLWPFKHPSCNTQAAGAHTHKTPVYSFASYRLKKKSTPPAPPQTGTPADHHTCGNSKAGRAQAA